jgi:hypothetical protein
MRREDPMNISEPFPFTLAQKPARLYVLRNDGYCWGRVIDHAGLEWDVSTHHDYYGEPDEIAAEAFIRKAQRFQLQLPAGSPILPTRLQELPK